VNDANLPRNETPQEEASELVARKYFGVTDEASRQRAIRKSLI
jgi:hypothetical protein